MEISFRFRNQVEDKNNLQHVSSHNNSLLAKSNNSQYQSVQVLEDKSSTFVKMLKILFSPFILLGRFIKSVFFTNAVEINKKNQEELEKIPKEGIDASVEKNPRLIFTDYKKLEETLGSKKAREIRKEAAFKLALIDPNFILENQAKSLYEYEPYASEVISTAKKLKAILNNLQKTVTFKETQVFLNKTLTEILQENDKNFNLDAVLNKVKEDTGIPLECIGISNGDGNIHRVFEFILANNFTSKNSEPVFIGLSCLELSNIKTEDELIELIKQKIKLETNNFKGQQLSWENFYKIDIPKDGSTACFLASVPGELVEIENDLAEIGMTYKENFNISDFTVCVENRGIWDELPQVKDGSLPKALTATKKNILDRFIKAANNAKASGKTTFIFHYNMHGDKNGCIKASDSDITSEEIAKAIASLDDNGGPLCKSMKFVIIADSCRSEIQGDKIIACLQNFKIGNKQLPVKDVTIITSSSGDGESYAALTAKEALVVNHSMKGFDGEDRSSAFNYYLSWYYKFLKYQRIRNEPLNPSFGNIFHAMHTVKKLAHYSKYKQNAKVIQYSTEQPPDKKPVKIKLINNLNPLNQRLTINEEIIAA
ncbi:MAG: caspase family protein [Candidatus Melainabacteria bacterium]|nr:caspase family protein [Candidatus Melainabacteria bacterium]